MLSKARVYAQKPFAPVVSSAAANVHRLCDLVLEYKGQKLAAVEAKKASVSYREGIAQAKDYGKRLAPASPLPPMVSAGIRLTCRLAGKDMDLPFPSPEVVVEDLLRRQLLARQFRRGAL